MPSLDEQQSRIQETLEAARSQIMSRVKDATALTEQEVIEIGRLLNQIVEVATCESDDTAQSFELLSGAEETSVTNRIKAQADLMSQFVNELGDRLDTQRTEADRAVGVCSQIGEATEAISAVAQRSQLLSLNISIEAARLGEQGRAVATIAQFMQDFTVSIESTTEKITGLLEELEQTMPVFLESSTETATRARKFSNEIVQDLGALGDSVHTLSTTLGSAASSATKRNAEVLTLSQETISHLAFQDPMAQKLLRAENDFLIMCGQIGEIADCEIEINTQHFANFCGNDTGEDAPDAGEVQLF